MRRTLVVVVVVMLAGCAAPLAPGDDVALEDDLGVVDGVAYDDELAISVDDGLNETELEKLATRSMARIEVIRELEFDRTVDVEVMTREEFREQRTSERNETAVQWENTVWEAKFVVGQDRDVTEVFDDTLGDAVQGFYSPSDERIVIVSDDGDADVSKHTLVHELVHALQDQQFGLEAPPDRQDPALAREGVVEGEAELIPELYFERCGAEWSCLEPPTRTQEQTEIDPGLALVIVQPYQQGPTFVEAIRERGGWEAVNDLHGEYPTSTAQIIDPGRYPDHEPVNVTVEDRSSGEWAPLEHDPRGETVGQVGIHVMLRQSGVVGGDLYGYSDPVSEGWAGDELVPYEREDGATGYVWELAWESAGDAEAFHDAYVDLLDEHGGLERGQRSFVIPEGPFEGAYDVRLEGTTVTVVNGPSVDSLEDVHTEGE